VSKKGKNGGKERKNQKIMILKKRVQKRVICFLA
jgi:hypothetical protein